MRFFSGAKFKFIEMRRGAYLVSAIVILVGIGAMVTNVFAIGAWQNYGVDFQGGSIVQVAFSQPTADAEVREALGGVDAPPISAFGGENEFTIRPPLPEDGDIQTVAQDISSQLEAAFGPGSFEILRTESVGPKIGEELQQKAAFAILFSFLLTMIYIAFRFEWRFGVAAVIATFHDVLVALGFIAVFRVEIALPTVAALLTIIGYSLNDTIVVFDRVRENLAAKGGRKEDPIALVNRSINETLPRTIMTSGTTLAVLLALAVLGGAVIRDFTLVLILGVVVGTYSSIFVASPALIEIQNRWGDGSEAEKRRKQRERDKKRREAAGVA